MELIRIPLTIQYTLAIVLSCWLHEIQPHCKVRARVLFVTVRLTCLALFSGLADSNLSPSETRASMMTHPSVRGNSRIKEQHDDNGAVILFSKVIHYVLSFTLVERTGVYPSVQCCSQTTLHRLKQHKQKKPEISSIVLSFPLLLLF